MGNERFIDRVMAAEEFAETVGGVWRKEYRTCSKCGREFVNPVVRERHEERCEGVIVGEKTEDGTFVCRDSECDASFSTNQGRSAHELIHRNGNCQFCGEEWILTGLGIHEAACEKNPKRIEWLRSRRGHCPHCDKKMLVSSIPYHVEHNCPVARYKRENEVVEHLRVDGEPEPVAKVPSVIVLTPDPVTVEEEIYEVLDLLLPDGFRARHTPAVVRWAEETAALVRQIREDA